ncbi:hypothetical protein GCM10020367_70990 [Streptomyces sannanensis]|uniref:Uncharacterized protein n=1 Tax=Streptomyces sannanensis TaxID=285536 RepID=A0ABP6SPB8_9ACTN
MLRTPQRHDVKSQATGGVLCGWRPGGRALTQCGPNGTVMRDTRRVLQNAHIRVILDCITHLSVDCTRSTIPHTQPPVLAQASTASRHATHPATAAAITRK